MKLARLVACIALAATLSAPLFAQQASSGYHNVACLKVKPENNAEFRKWISEDPHKLAQSRVDGGAYSQWLLLRAVYPAGHTAECDYLVVTMYPGIPPAPMGIDGLGGALKKAGIAASAQQYVERRTALTTLISNSMFQNQASVGSFKKDDYLVVNYMKVADGNLEDYLAWEKKVWKPLAEAMAKDGIRTGWSLNTRVLPNGSDQPFQAVTVDVFSSWESIYKDDAQFVDRWHKVHPDLELGTTFEKYEKLRTLSSAQLYVVQDLIQAGK